MGLFRRRRGSASSPGAAIADFWAAWPAARSHLEDAIASGEFGDVVDTVGARVAAIDPALRWELTPGRRARYALVVSACGQRALRSVAERWRRAGPAPDVDWEFHSARQPDPAALAAGSLTLDGHDVALDLVTFGLQVDDDRAVVDVTVYHPGFAAVSERVRVTVAFLVLDWLLGEDEVERWIGGVDIATSPPLDALPASSLRGVVAQVAERHREPRWAVLSGRTEQGLPVLASVRLPLKPVEHPLFDLHVGVDVPYVNANNDRLPVDPSLAALCNLEDLLTDRLGEEAVFVGQESRGGARLLHFYADSDATVPAQIEAMCRSWAEGRVQIEPQLDGGWACVEHLRI